MKRLILLLVVLILAVLVVVTGLYFLIPPKIEYIEKYVTEIVYREVPYEVPVYYETVVETVIEVEVEKTVYRNIYSRSWESEEQFIEWYYAQGFTFLVPSGEYKIDCEDYAKWVQREALEQGYRVSIALTWFGKYYNVRVNDKFTDRAPGHAGNLVEIKGVFYYFEPQIEDFKGLVRVVSGD